jgi:hypothetical protein
MLMDERKRRNVEELLARGILQRNAVRPGLDVNAFALDYRIHDANRVALLARPGLLVV